MGQQLEENSIVSFIFFFKQKKSGGGLKKKLLFSDHHLFFLAEVSHEQKKKHFEWRRTLRTWLYTFVTILDLVYFLFFQLQSLLFFFNYFVLFVNYTFKNKIQKPQ